MREKQYDVTQCKSASPDGVFTGLEFFTECSTDKTILRRAEAALTHAQPSSHSVNLLLHLAFVIMPSRGRIHVN
jgi:hypothetical protein